MTAVFFLSCSDSDDSTADTSNGDRASEGGGPQDDDGAGGDGVAGGDGEGGDNSPVECVRTPEDFEPDEVPDMSLWVRADCGVTVDDLGVARWDDLSRSNNDLFRIETDTAAPLQVGDTIGNRAGIRFDGDSRLRLVNDLALSELTLVYVGQVRKESDEEFQMIFGPTTINHQLRYETRGSLSVVAPEGGWTIRFGEMLEEHSFIIARGAE